VKVKARVSETGQEVDAHIDSDWASVHPTDPRARPLLYCPERSCYNRVSAVELQNASGQVTRFFRFVRNGPTCVHAEVDEPVVVVREPPARTGETDEHQWLKDYVQRMAIRLGYDDAATEVTLSDTVRADVFVPNVPYGRVEVQRVATDVAERTRHFDDVVWLLRATFNETNKRYLFTWPCVQVRVVRRQGDRWVIAEPWRDGLDGALVRATATVLQARPTPNAGEEFGFFETEKHVPLAAFLGDVWSGQRRWYGPKTAHRFGGWITVEDFARYTEWTRERRALGENPPSRGEPLADEATTSASAALDPPQDQVGTQDGPRLTDDLGDESPEPQTGLSLPAPEPPAAPSWWTRFRRWLTGGSR